MNHTKTIRGFALVNFQDTHGASCSLQESSIASPPSVWLGIDDANPQIMARNTPEGGNGWVKFELPDGVLLNTRMHLDQALAKDLISVLQHFVDTGELRGASPDEQANHD